MTIKKKGLTLIETMIYVSMISGLFVGVYKLEVEKSKDVEKETFVNNVSDLLAGVDKRLSIDGFDPSLWTKSKWADKTELSENLINGDLRPKASYSAYSAIMQDNGCEGKWVPQNALDEKSNLVQCNMWKGKLPLSMEVQGDLNVDTNNFVDGFDFMFEFDSDKDFERNFLLLKEAYFKLKKQESAGVAGTYDYKFVDKNKSALTITQCIKAKTDCFFLASFSRTGGKAELRVDGQNKMIGSNISFIEREGSAPLQCIRWKKDSLGAWVKTGSDQECGIGVYQETGVPVVVEVVAANGTFENVTLSEQCNLFNWSSVSNSLVIDNSKVSPCGMTNDGGAIYQVIKNIKSENAYVENFYFNDLDIKMVDVNSIVSKSINTDYLEVVNTATVFESDLGHLVSNNFADINGVAQLNNNLEVQGDANIKSITTTYQHFETEDLNLKDTATIDALTGDNLTIDYGASQRRISGSSVQFTGTDSSGHTCSKTGKISKDSNGNMLVCKSGIWTKAASGVPVGTITAWTSYSIPSGWLKCNGAGISTKYSELRSIVGSYTPDLRGRFVRGHGSSKYSGSASAGLGSVQGEEIASHKHQQRQWSGTDSAGGGKDKAANNAVYRTWTGYDGIESRPKNYSVIYIIKAE